KPHIALPLDGKPSECASILSLRVATGPSARVGYTPVTLPSRISKGATSMDLTPEQQQLRESYVITLLEAIAPLQQKSSDPEVTLELLIEAAELLKEHLQNKLNELRKEQAE